MSEQDDLNAILTNDPPVLHASTETAEDFATVRHLVAEKLAPSDGDLLLPETTPISSQGSGGSCAPTATCDGFELVMPEPVQLSRDFVYWNARRAAHEEAADAGTDLYKCFQAIKVFGACEETFWPYDVGRIPERPPLAAYERAYDNRLAAFYNIRPYGADLLPSIDGALRGGLPVPFGLRINVDAFYNYKVGTVIEAPSFTTAGHAMVIVGYRTLPSGRKVYVLRNSWNVSWGDRGYALIAPEYLTAGLYSAEFFVPVALPLTPIL